MQKLRGVLYCLLTVLCSAHVQAQGYDRAGSLNGRYWFRYVQFSGVTASGNFSRARSLAGSLTFDGKGSYSASAAVSDTTTPSLNGALNLFSGIYRLQENGVGSLGGVAEQGTATSIDIGVGDGTIIGHRYGSTTYGIFIAVLAGPSSTTNAQSLLNGNWAGGILEFVGGQQAQGRTASVKFSSNGQGAFSNVVANGSAFNLAAGLQTQNATNVTYTLAISGSGTVQFGTPGGTAAQSLISGTKNIYAAPNGDFLFGGSPTGYDFFFAVKTPGSGGRKVTMDGNYFTADLTYDVESTPPNKFFYGFFGSSRYGATGSMRHRLWHEKNDDPFDWTTPGDPLTFEADGTIDDGKDGLYVLGNNASIMMYIGRTSPEVFLAIRFPEFRPSGTVYLYPNGVLNAASYAPITNPIAPGELINLYGVGFGTGTTVAQSLPFPTTLANVTVTIAGLRAPIYYVSPNTISAIVPYGINLSDVFAPIVVNVNGTNSNTVNMLTWDAAPGVFTLSQNGFGPAAVLHADFTLVNQAKPAKPGETVLLFLTGLGAVNPKIADGAAGPVNPLARATSTVNIYIGSGQAKVSYAGLAPNLAALYQINFEVPPGAKTGTYDIQISTGGTLGYQGTIDVQQ